MLLVSSGNVTPLKLVGHLRGRSWHERDAFAGRPKKNVLVVPVVSSFVWIAAACCCALRRRRGSNNGACRVSVSSSFCGYFDVSRVSMAPAPLGLNSVMLSFDASSGALERPLQASY